MVTKSCSLGGGDESHLQEGEGPEGPEEEAPEPQTGAVRHEEGAEPFKAASKLILEFGNRPGGPRSVSHDSSVSWREQRKKEK